MNPRIAAAFLFVLRMVVLSSLSCAMSFAAGTEVHRIDYPITYPDSRPAAAYRLDATDAGVVLRHGDGPDQCDVLGARDVWVWEHNGSYYLHYDGAGPTGWLACLATSSDLVHWTKRGAVLALGTPGSRDSASASYGVPYFDGTTWHLFYMGTPHTSGPPELVPAFPYLTLKARGDSAIGPWTKQPDITPFRPQPDTYYSSTASPGYVVSRDGDYVMVFSAATDQPTMRTLGLARTKDLNGPWTIDPAPILPATEQVENSSLYHDEARGVWWLFTNHVGLKDRLEYTDAIWAYWTTDLEHWNPAHKAIVLDEKNCTWSRHIVGLPSVVQVGQRLAIFYDGSSADPMPRGVKSHMHRDVGLAWLDLPLIPPVTK